MAETTAKTKEMNVTDTSVYEVGYHIVPLVAEDALGVEVSNIRSAIEKHGGVIFSEDFPQMRNLSYPIVRAVRGKKEPFTESYFGWFKFDVAPEGIPGLQDDLKLSEQILRFIVIETIRETAPIKKASILKEIPLDRPIETPVAPVPVESEKTPMMTDEELDKTIEDLVIE